MAHHRRLRRFHRDVFLPARRARRFRRARGAGIAAARSVPAGIRRQDATRKSRPAAAGEPIFLSHMPDDLEQSRADDMRRNANMRSRVRAAWLAGWAASAGPGAAAAWGFAGHRIVGAIADLVLQQHEPATQQRVSELLEKNDGGTVEKRSLSEVAVFPDCAKKNNVPFCGRPPSEEEKAYAGRNPHHDKFHFADVPLQQPSYVPSTAGTQDIDVVQMIGYAVTQLRGKPPPAKPDVNLTDTEAVWLLAHLVGDIHQPLHVGAKYFDKACQTSVDPYIGGTPPTFGIGDTVAMTMGGNLILLVAPAPAVPPASNLHLYWDSTAVVRAMQAAGSPQSEQGFAKLL